MDNLYNHFKDIEKSERSFLKENPFIVIRVDGRGFSKLTKKIKKPFDLHFAEAIKETGTYLLNEVPNAILAYSQSDEISVIIKGDNTGSQQWFSNNIQKITSLTSSMATLAFNRFFQKQYPDLSGIFNARAFTLESEEEVIDYLNWRRSDCRKNSISMNAEPFMTAKESLGLNSLDRLELAKNNNADWEVLDEHCKNGTLASIRNQLKFTEYMHRKTKEVHRVTVPRKTLIVEPAKNRFNLQTIQNHRVLIA